MKRIACFCIPAHGHTNPMLPVIVELVKRGNDVRFYSFDEFREKINTTGAVFISCDKFLPKLSEKEMVSLKSVSTTEMTLKDISITLLMNDFLDEEFKTFKPNVVCTDSVCFWGKLSALKHNVPMVVSTSTFAFNKWSSQYMKHSPHELADMIFGLPKVSKALRSLEPYGYKVKSALELVQSDNNTDSIVYTSKRFQPYSKSFSEHYAFVGPSVFSTIKPNKAKARPLIYISMGTVINNRPDFYKKCIGALKGLDIDVIISYGKVVDIAALGPLPENIKVYPYVDQFEVLSRADGFITHCGMNSVSESLFMATPMLLYPQTNEQKAVARRVVEINAGIMLDDDLDEGIKTAIEQLLGNCKYKEGAEICSKEFRACSGPKGAAEFIESAPHTAQECEIVKKIDAQSKSFNRFYWLIVIALTLFVGLKTKLRFPWLIALLGGLRYLAEKAHELQPWDERR